MSTMAPVEHGLPNLTFQKLESIRQRRTVLLLVRTAAVVSSVFLALLLTGALIDKFWNLSEPLRVWWSLATYAAAMLVGVASIYPLFRRWGLREAAQIVELEVPRLRNKLLSAVELPADSDEPRMGSAELRRQLQTIVVAEVGSVEPTTVLPWRRIRAILFSLGGTCLLIAGLAAVPHWQIPQHMWRMLLPIANVPRPSLADVRMLEPGPNAAVLALNETQRFRAQVELPTAGQSILPESMHLEIRAKIAGRQTVRVTMKRDFEAGLVSPVDNNPRTDVDAEAIAAVVGAVDQSQRAYYSALVNVEDRVFDYRVVSEIGETPWYASRAEERPKVEEFTIVVTPPDYAGVESQTLVAPTGDVAVIDGSRVSWALKTNVPLTEAKMRWRDEAATTNTATTPATADDGGSRFAHNAAGAFVFSSPAITSRSFQIDLRSVVGLNSTFPPTHELVVKTDKAPRLSWLKPKELARVIRPRSAAALKIAMEDEYPIQRLEQWSRVNRGTWRIDSLPAPTVAVSESEWIWEIAVLNAKIGDLIETKIVAVDRKGQAGESPTGEWVVSGTELDATRDAETLVREEIAKLIGRLKPIVRAKQQRLKELTEAWRQNVNDPAATKELSSEITTSVDDLARLLNDTQTQVEPLMGRLRNPVSLEEVNLLLDAITQWASEADVIRLTLELAVAREPVDQRQGMIDRFRGRYENCLYGLDRLPSISQVMVSHDILADFSRDLEDALQFQRELLRDEESIGTKVWQREQMILSEYLVRVGQGMHADSGRLPDGPANGLREWAQIVEQLGEKSARLAEEEGVQAYKVQEIVNEIHARVNLLQIYSWLPDEVVNMRRELFQHSGKTQDIIVRAMNDWRYERQFATDGSVPTDSIRATMETVQRRRATRYSRGDHSVQYAADLGLAHRAMEHQIQLNNGDPQQIDQRLQQIAEAVATIESGQKVENARRFLETTLETERFAATGKVARTENPRLWEAFGQQLEWAHENMRNVAVVHEIAGVINGLRWSTAAQAAWQKMGPRRWDLHSRAVSAASDLESVVAELSKQEVLLQPSVEAARRLLAELGPSIEQLAQEGAEAARAAQAATEQLQTELRAEEVPNTAERLQQNQAEHHRAREKTSERLKDALVDRAAAQDILEQRQRKKAEVADLARELLLAAEQRTTQAEQAAEQRVADDNTDTNNDSHTEANADADSKPVAEMLDDLKQAQSREAETLQAIAEHYSRPEQNDADVESAPRPESLERLAQEQDPASSKARESLQQQAESLAALADADPRDLLRSLEQELTRDEAMQEELSDIARQLADQSQRSIEHAAEREQALRQSLEQSDAVREPLRREFADNLNQALEATEKLASRLRNETQNEAIAGNQKDARRQVQDVAHQLEEAAAQARQQAKSGLNRDMQQAAQQLNSALQAMQPELQTAAQTLANAKQENPYEQEDQQARERDRANQTQDQLANQDRQRADQAIQSRQQQEQRVQQAIQQAQNEVAQTEQQLQNYREQLKNQPENEWVKQEAQNTEARIEQQREVQKTLDGVRQRAEGRTRDAQQDRQRQDQNPPRLEAANPHGELAERLSQQAAAQAAELSQDLQNIMNEAGFMAETQASRGELKQASGQQASVQNQVAAAAQDIERAAAHQERLGAQESAEAWQAAAERVADTANREPRDAQTQMQQAQPTNPEAGNPLQANASDTQRVDESLKSANLALQQRADELSEMLGQSSDADQASGSQSPVNEPSAGNPSAGNPILSQMGPRAKAELLDQLARQLSGSEAGPDASSSDPSMRQSSSPKAGVLQSSARSLQQQLQQQRTQQMSPGSQPPSNVASRTERSAQQSGAAAISSPTAAGMARVLASAETDAEPIGAWSRLREQNSADVTESQKEVVSPRYRRQIENYFKRLSEKSRER
ncbi:MAG: hypothetical protein Q8M16_21505 [Pirellulaceae bacterium]|nr:hypothetical protein [Pirellulaceae bacterium]